MMTVIRKNQLIALVIAIACVSVGYLSYVNKDESLPVIDEISDPTLTSKLGEAVMANANDDNIAEYNNDSTYMAFFEETRLERDRLRDQEVFMQEMVLNSESVTQELQQKAQAELTEIGKRTEQELIAESLIKAKGFSEAVVFINTDSVNVIVFNEGTELTKSQVAQIKEVIASEIGSNIENLKIVVK